VRSGDWKGGYWMDAATARALLCHPLVFGCPLQIAAKIRLRRKDGATLKDRKGAERTAEVMR